MPAINKALVKFKASQFDKLKKEANSCGIFLIAQKKYIRKGDPLPDFITPDSIPNYRLLKRAESRPRKLYTNVKRAILQSTR